MNRKLTEKETALNQKAIDRLTKEVNAFKESLEYNDSLIEKQLQSRHHDDKFRDYLRKQKDEQDQDVISKIESEIRMREITIKETQKQIDDGVKIKKVAGID